MVKVTILGGSGRMGTSLVRAIRGYKEELELVAVTEREGLSCVGMDSGTLAGVEPNGVAVTTDLEDAVKKCDVVIDFTFHTTVPATSKFVAEGSKVWVLGTTGLDKEEQECVEAASKKCVIIRSANMSLGINMLLKLVQEAAAILRSGYDVEITEIHHKHKKDAPSGTALMLAKAVADGRGVNLDDVACYGRHGVSDEERNPDTIAIHAIRGGDVVGDHTVMFACDGERVEITHKASSRECFAGGALKAALWAIDKKPGIYNMKDVLGI